MKESDYTPTIDINFGPIEDRSQDIIKVIGVGGGGCNAVNMMHTSGIKGVSFAVVNTDSSSLAKSDVPVKIQLGEGLGAGGDPEKGCEAAESGRESLGQLFDDACKMVFVTATMGGGTGTGAAPVVASMAKEKGLLTIGVVTIPFYFEHRNKIKKALKGVERMKACVDALLIVNNEQLCKVYSNSFMSLKEGFRIANDVLQDAVKGIAELITVSTEDDINLDFCDVQTTMSDGGQAIMAIGRASGEGRVNSAILNALESPLLYGNDIGSAKRILFNIYSSETNPLLISEMNEIADFFNELDSDIDVIWGTQTDNSLGGDLKVLLLASDIPDDILSDKLSSSSVDNDNEHFERLITRLYMPGELHQTSRHSTVEQVDSGSESDAFEVHTEPIFTINNAQESEEGPTAKEPIVNKWKRWLNKQLDTIMSDVSDNDDN